LLALAAAITGIPVVLLSIVGLPWYVMGFFTAILAPYIL